MKVIVDPASEALFLESAARLFAAFRADPKRTTVDEDLQRAFDDAATFVRFATELKVYGLAAKEKE